MTLKLKSKYTLNLFFLSIMFIDLFLLSFDAQTKGNDSILSHRLFFLLFLVMLAPRWTKV